jgi:prephenate dehydrogenase
MKHVVIVGFGLIGGSLALALRRGGGVHVTAIDRAEVLSTAAARAAADELLTLDRPSELQEALERSSITVLAVPVGTIIQLLPWALAHAAVVTDCGSTKNAIAEAAAEHPRGACFVPGHPMAGLPDGGIENARADLFENRSWILHRARATTEAAAMTTELIEQTGANVIELDPKSHDHAVAITSHLPQLLASALSSLADTANATLAAGPAFERATRAAGGPESMWSDIFETNASAIAGASESLCAELARVAAGLRQNPPEVGPALSLLARARSTKP